jgi:hypothetical protein
MKRQARLMILLLMAISQAAQAESTLPQVKVEELSIVPLEGPEDGEVFVRWLIRNVGTVPVSVEPSVSATGSQEFRVKAKASQLIVPSQTATGSAVGRRHIGADGASSLIYVSVHDVDRNVDITGYVDPRSEWMKSVLPKRNQPAEPTAAVEAQTDRPVYFPGETVSVLGRVLHAQPRELAVTGAIHQQCPVADDGRFELTFPARGTGKQKLTFEVEGLPQTTLEFVVVSGEVAFPRLFGTDRTYRTGLFQAMAQEHWPMLPYWAKRLGTDFVALCQTGGWAPGPQLEEMFTAADQLNMTFALVVAAQPHASGMAMNGDGLPNIEFRNVLVSSFQEALTSDLRRLASAFRHHRSFRYLLFMPETFNMRANTGYNPENLKRFAEEVLKQDRPGMSLPAFEDPEGWYKLLREDSDLWEKWLTWRERLWTNYFCSLRNELKATKPDLDLGTIETNFIVRGMWNLQMLIDAGITDHAPSTWFPTDGGRYWQTLWGRDWYRLRYNQELFASTLSIWWDTNYDSEQILSGLFGVVKAGGTRTAVWCDSGFRVRGGWKYLNPDFSKGNIKKLEQWADVTAADEALQSPITDMITGVDNHRKARALEQSSAQLKQLPYKDRFAVYERYDGKLPLEFAVHWREGERDLTAQSADNGTSAGDPHDPVYATVQDYQANGYVEMLLFNDVAQRGRTKWLYATGLPAEAYTFEPESLRERELTVTVTSASDAVPFIDGEPWAHYERKENTLVIKSIPFQAQQVRLLQLVRCGREMPHVMTSAGRISHTAVNLDGKTLWLKLGEQQAGNITIDCADWGEPKNIVGGKSIRTDAASHLIEISTDEKVAVLTVNW